MILCLACMGCSKDKPDRAGSSPGRASRRWTKARDDEARTPAGSPRAQPDLPEPRRAPPTAADEDKKAVVQGANRFAIDLYSKIRTEPGNLFVSPWSIITALAMTYAGARTETAEEMKKVLHFPWDQERLHPAFGALDAALEAGQEGGGYQLSMANRIWPKAGDMLASAFLKILADSYGARPQPLDYIADLDGSRKTINRWVAKKTASKITELLKKGDLTHLVRLVLTNAIYFKGKWESPFMKVSTHKASFHLSPDKTVQVDMMLQTKELHYTETPALQAVLLPYKGRDLEMLFVLPREKTGLTEVEPKLFPKMIEHLVRRTALRKVHVYLPRFKVRSRLYLVKTLKAMGMKLAFDSIEADFTGIIQAGKKGDLVISKVIHEAICELDEEGTVAAAATAVVMDRGTGAPRPVPIFRADHPFLVFLLHSSKKRDHPLHGQDRQPDILRCEHELGTERSSARRRA